MYFAGQKSKLKQRFRKHRKKFGRFNKTAPMPIDMMIQGKSEAETENTFQLAVRSYVQYTETSTQIPRNYLIRRPATAPAKISSFKLKGTDSSNLFTFLKWYTYRKRNKKKIEKTVT